MTIKQSSPRKKIFGITSVLVGIVAVGIFLAVDGYTHPSYQLRSVKAGRKSVPITGMNSWRTGRLSHPRPELARVAIPDI